MLVKVDLSTLKETRWYELCLRFCSGGLATALTGVIAKEYGPSIGGLFLAFPAILPATATLIEKHEREKKQKAGMNGENRARKAVALDAAGARIGSLGLLLFALLVWRLLPEHSPWWVIFVATGAWLTLSVVLWQLRRKI